MKKDGLIFWVALSRAPTPEMHKPYPDASRLPAGRWLFGSQFFLLPCRRRLYCPPYRLLRSHHAKAGCEIRFQVWYRCCPIFRKSSVDKLVGDRCESACCLCPYRYDGAYTEQVDSTLCAQRIDEAFGVWRAAQSSGVSWYSRSVRQTRKRFAGFVLLWWGLPKPAIEFLPDERNTSESCRNLSSPASFEKKMAECSFQPTSLERAGIRVFYLVSEPYYRQALHLWVCQSEYHQSPCLCELSFLVRNRGPHQIAQRYEGRWFWWTWLCIHFGSVFPHELTNQVLPHRPVYRGQSDRRLSHRTNLCNAYGSPQYSNLGMKWYKKNVNTM